MKKTIFFLLFHFTLFSGFADTPGSQEYTAVAWSPNGKYLAAATRGEVERLTCWDVSTRKPRWTYPQQPRVFDIIRFSPDSKFVYAVENNSVYYLETESEYQENTVWSPGSNTITALAVSLDGNYFVYTRSHNAVEFCPTKHNIAHKDDWPVAESEPYSVALSPDNRFLCAGLDNGEVFIAQNSMYKITKQRRLAALEQRITALAWSSDGKKIIAGTTAGMVFLIDVETGRTEQKYSGHSGKIIFLSFSSDARHILSAAGDGTFRLWDTKSGALLQKIQPDSGQLTALACSPDGKQVALGTSSGSLEIWDIPAGKRLYTLEIDKDTSDRLAAEPNPHPKKNVDIFAKCQQCCIGIALCSNIHTRGDEEPASGEAEIVQVQYHKQVQKEDIPPHEQHLHIRASAGSGYFFGEKNDAISFNSKLNADYYGFAVNINYSYISKFSALNTQLVSVNLGYAITDRNFSINMYMGILADSSEYSGFSAGADARFATPFSVTINMSLLYSSNAENTYILSSCAVEVPIGSFSAGAGCDFYMPPLQQFLGIGIKTSYRF